MIWAVITLAVSQVILLVAFIVLYRSVQSVPMRKMLDADITQVAISHRFGEPASGIIEFRDKSYRLVAQTHTP